MSKVDKNRQNNAFYSLDKARQNAIVMLFEDELTDKEIAKNVHRSRATLGKWKNDPKFKRGQQAYKKIIVKDSYENKAIKKLNSLLEAKSEMVQLQSATTILKLSGLLSDNSTPELDAARIRKANADADVSEAKAKQLKEGTSLDGVTIQFVRSDREEEKDSENDQS